MEVLKDFSLFLDIYTCTLNIKLSSPLIYTQEKGDSNTEWFKENWGDGEAYQIELDAMHARRERFKEFLLSTVDQYFDNKIHQREVKKPQEKARKTITALANRMIEEQFPLEHDAGRAEA